MSRRPSKEEMAAVLATPGAQRARRNIVIAAFAMSEMEMIERGIATVPDDPNAPLTFKGTDVPIDTVKEWLDRRDLTDRGNISETWDAFFAKNPTVTQSAFVGTSVILTMAMAKLSMAFRPSDDEPDHAKPSDFPH